MYYAAAKHTSLPRYGRKTRLTKLVTRMLKSMYGFDIGFDINSRSAGPI